MDARLLCTGGIGTYIREVVGPWVKNHGIAHLHLLGRPSEIEPWLNKLETTVPIDVTEWSDPPYAARAHLRWPLRLAPALHQSEVVFFPHYDVPVVGHRLPFVVVVHDLTQFLLPEVFPYWKRKAGRFLLDRAVAGSRQVITVSERTRDDLLGVMKGEGNQEKVVAISNGVGSAFFPLSREEEDDAIARWKHLMPYFLLVGWDRPHKNTSLALAMLEGLRQRGHDCNLLLAGEGGRMLEPLRTEARARGVERHVHELGRMNEAPLRELYSLTSAVVVPSFYEGFGLPLLEGLACGAPVIASDRGSLGEIAGPATVLSPDDPAAWIDAAERILSEGPRDAASGGAEVEDERRAAGLAHARQYDWGRTSRTTLELLRRHARP